MATVSASWRFRPVSRGPGLSDKSGVGTSAHGVEPSATRGRTTRRRARIELAGRRSAPLGEFVRQAVSAGRGSPLRSMPVSSTNVDLQRMQPRLPGFHDLGGAAMRSIRSGRSTVSRGPLSRGSPRSFRTVRKGWSMGRESASAASRDAAALGSGRGNDCVGSGPNGSLSGGSPRRAARGGPGPGRRGQASKGTGGMPRRHQEFGRGRPR